MVLDIKLKNFAKALEDCKSCLEREPNNVKALFRKAESLLGLNKNNDAVDTFLDIMEIEPSNVHALKAYNDLSSRYPSNRKITGTRIRIKDSDAPVIVEKELKKVNKLKLKEVDYAELIKPEKTIKNQFLTAMENISSKSATPAKTEKEFNMNFNLESNNVQKNNVFIEEI